MEESRGAGALAAFLRPYHGTCLRVSVTSEHQGGGGVCSGADGRDTELVGMSRNPSECCPTACDDGCQMVTKVLGMDGWAGYVTCRSSVSATVRTQALKSGQSTSACGAGSQGAGRARPEGVPRTAQAPPGHGSVGSFGFWLGCGRGLVGVVFQLISRRPPGRRLLPEHLGAAADCSAVSRPRVPGPLQLEAPAC